MPGPEKSILLYLHTKTMKTDQNLPLRTKSEIAENWLPRYTGLELQQFGKYRFPTQGLNLRLSIGCLSYLARELSNI